MIRISIDGTDCLIAVEATTSDLFQEAVNAVTAIDQYLMGLGDSSLAPMFRSACKDGVPFNRNGVQRIDLFEDDTCKKQ